MLRRLPRLAAAVAVIVVALTVLAPAARAAPSVPFTAADRGDLQYVSRHAKLQLLRARGFAPELVVFGGSRVFKVQPSYLEAQTGLETFNCSVSDCRPADVWAFENYVRDELPGGQPRYVWFLAVEAFRTVNEVPSALNDIPELGRYLWPTAAAGPPAPGSGGLAAAASRWRWDADGWLWYSPWDAARRDGRTLEDLLPRTLERYRGWYRTQFPALSAISLEYLRDTVLDMNAAGEAPLIVLPPYLPRLRLEIERYGFKERRAELRAFFTQLRADVEFTLIDLSRWRGPEGWRRGFYDGVHMDARLCRMVLRELFRSSWWTAAGGVAAAG